MATEPLAASLQQATSSTQRFAASKVLIVDDEPTNLTILAHLLQPHVSVRVARGGERGWALAQRERPDIVLLDVEMPDLDGYEICRRIKADPLLASVPVIFLTSRSSVDDELRGFEVGAVDYILKPISPPLLLSRVRTHLALRCALSDAQQACERADALLDVVLPPSAAAELRTTATIQPRRIDPVAVLFADVVGFTAWCEQHTPEEVVTRLHDVFSCFETLAREFGVDKLKTLGDGFMAGVGLFAPVDQPLLQAVRCGLEMARAVERLFPDWRVRVGVHQGPVVAGIVGTERYQFDVWGDTVNTAARLAQTGRPGVVSLLASSYEGIGERFQSTPGGLRQMKGKGALEVVDLEPGIVEERTGA
jgi:DNA-binding response OmpR family regulator